MQLAKQLAMGVCADVTDKDKQLAVETLFSARRCTKRDADTHQTVTVRPVLLASSEIGRDSNDSQVNQSQRIIFHFIASTFPENDTWLTVSFYFYF